MSDKAALDADNVRLAVAIAPVVLANKDVILANKDKVPGWATKADALDGLDDVNHEAGMVDSSAATGMDFVKADKFRGTAGMVLLVTEALVFILMLFSGVRSGAPFCTKTVFKAKNFGARNYFFTMATTALAFQIFFMYCYLRNGMKALTAKKICCLWHWQTLEFVVHGVHIVGLFFACIAMSVKLPKLKESVALDLAGCKFGTWTAALVFMWILGMTSYTIVFYKVYTELRAMGKLTWLPWHWQRFQKGGVKKSESQADITDSNA